MKKAMKLVWMVLFALPLISLTACGDDEETIEDNEGVEVSFKDYSFLLDKTMTDVLDKQMKDYNPYLYTDGSGIYYYGEDNDLGENVDGLLVYYWFEDEDEDGNDIVLYKSEKSLIVKETVYGFSKPNIFNYLKDKYGEATMLADGTQEFSKGNMYVWLEYYSEDEIDITYINKKEYDKYYRSRSNNDGAGLRKALRNRK